MRITEIILVTENYKGNEQNLLMTFKDFMKKYIIGTFDNVFECAEIAVKLDRTNADRDKWEEIYYAANKSLSFRYCCDEDQLVSFLLGYYGPAKKVSLDTELCSKECLEILQSYGITAKGTSLQGYGKSYEKIEKGFVNGEILHNFNGNLYKVIRVLSEKNLLLNDIRTGQYVVGVGTERFVRYPKMAGRESEHCVYGIEWGHGVYLGNDPCVIDFDILQKQYGSEEEITNLVQYREKQKKKFVFLNKITESEMVNNEVRIAAQKNMYGEFMTGKMDTFFKNLENGKYDTGFYKSVERERSR